MNVRRAMWVEAMTAIETLSSFLVSGFSLVTVRVLLAILKCSLS